MPSARGGGAEALRQRGPARTTSRPSRSSRGRATTRRQSNNNVDVEANTKKLRDTLQQAEARQVADWVRTRHKAIDYDLSSTAARLEGSLPRAKIPNSSRPTSLRADEHEGGGLATTWPLGSSSLRVDGHGLSNTLPKDVGISVADSCNNQSREWNNNRSPARSAKPTSFARRVRDAMEMQGLDARMLKEYLVPSCTAHPEDTSTSVQSWEVFKVLALDVGINLTEDDKKLIETKFGDGGIDGGIDVNRLMASLGLRLPEDEPERSDTAHELGVEEEYARLDQNSTGPLDALDSAVHPAVHPMNTLDPAVSSAVDPMNHLDPLDPAVDSAIDPINPLDPVEDPLDPLNPRVGTKLSVGLEKAAAGIGTNKDGRDPSKEPDKTALEEENARLRSELAVFDLGFFEEVEDLKYSYATLKQEATKLANKQGVDLSASLDLPEEGEEPWNRSVDMAHHSVDWREVSKQRPRGSSSSPPRGAHAARLTERWQAITDGEGSEYQRRFPPELASSLDVRGLHGRGRRRVAEGSAESGTGVVAAHERKLAWELSSGGLRSLESLREHTRRVGTSGSEFLSDQQVLMALRQAGYALDVEDVSTLRTGLGIDADGKVDLKEFMSMCEDIASSQEWYLPPREVILSTEAMLPTAGENERFAEAGDNPPVPPAMFGRGEVSSHLHRSGLFCSSSPERPPPVPAGTWPTASQYLGGTAYGEKVFLEPLKSAEGVLREVQDQLSLLDMDVFVAAPESVRRTGVSDAQGGNGRMATLGEAVRIKFSRRDPTLSGTLSAREVGLALEDIGVVLQPGEVVTLARKFAPPGRHSPRGDRASGVPYPEDASRAAEGGGLDGVLAEYAPLVRWIVDRIAESSGIDPTVGGRARIGIGGKWKWNERMPAPASRLRAALAAGERNGWINRLRKRFHEFDIDEEGTLGRREFMRALNLALAEETGDETIPSPDQIVGGVLSAEEAVELMGRLDRDRDGKVCWKEFVEYFVGADGAGSDDAHSEPWFEQVGDIAQKLLELVESQGGSAARRAWVNDLSRRFQTEDFDGNGELPKGEFCRCLFDLGVSLTLREGNRLFSALRSTAEGARYDDLIDFLRSNGAKWYEVERDVADKIMQAMGPDAPSRRAWLNGMRRRFMSLDAFRAGVMGASDLLQALRDGGCYLSLEEEAKLLDALETQESARLDIEGGVSYRELLLFCAKHAGRWNDAHPALAERLREALRNQAKTGADVRRLFRSLDHDGDGFIGRKDFRITLSRLGLRGDSTEEEEALMDALDAEGSGLVRYGDFASFFTDTAPLSKAESDLAERLCESLEVEGGGGPGTVLGTLRKRFVQADRAKNGYLDRAQFRRVLLSLPGTANLTDHEIGRLSSLLDEEGDGRVSYRSLLDLLVKRLGDWTKRLPEVAWELSFALKHIQYGFKACVESLSRRIEIADHSGTGRLTPGALGRCLHSVGLELTLEQLRQMVTVMDSHGDGLIPTEPVLEFLRKEAGVSSAPGDDASIKQADGKIGADFREAVRGLARMEQASRPVSDEENDGDRFTRRRRRRSWEGMWGTIPLSERLRRVFDRRLDLDGDGYLTERDLVACLPEIGVDTDRQGAKALLTAMDSRGRGLGQATFKDFTEFVGRDGSSAAGGNEERVNRYSVGEKDMLSPTRRRLLQQIRLALGISEPGNTSATGTADAIVRQDMRFALARLDPLGSGRLSLAKIKSGLQGLGLPVGMVPRASWLDLTGSLDQDANGHLFYEDFVDLLLPPLAPSSRRINPPTQSSSRRNASAERTPTWRERRRQSLSPTRTRTATGLTNRRRRSPTARTAARTAAAAAAATTTRPATATASKTSTRGSASRTRPTTATTAATTTADGPRRGESQIPWYTKTPIFGHNKGDDDDDDDEDDKDWRRTHPPSSRRWSLSRVKAWQGRETAAHEPSQLSLLSERICDCVSDEHGGILEGAKALRSALRRQDLTRSGTLSQGEFQLALESAGVPLTSKEVAVLFRHFVRRGGGGGGDMVDYNKFANRVLSHERRTSAGLGDAGGADGETAAAEKRPRMPAAAALRRERAVLEAALVSNRKRGGGRGGDGGGGGSRVSGDEGGGRHVRGVVGRVGHFGDGRHGGVGSGDGGSRVGVGGGGRRSIRWSAELDRHANEDELRSPFRRRAEHMTPPPQPGRHTPPPSYRDVGGNASDDPTAARSRGSVGFREEYGYC